MKTISIFRYTNAYLGKKMAILFSTNKIGKVTVNQNVGVIQDGIKPASCGEQGLEKIITAAVSLHASQQEVKSTDTQCRSVNHRVPSAPQKTLHKAKGLVHAANNSVVMFLNKVQHWKKNLRFYLGRQFSNKILCEIPIYIVCRF